VVIAARFTYEVRSIGAGAALILDNIPETLERKTPVAALKTLYLRVTCSDRNEPIVRIVTVGHARSAFEASASDFVYLRSVGIRGGRKRELGGHPAGVMMRCWYESNGDHPSRTGRRGY